MGSTCQIPAFAESTAAVAKAAGHTAVPIAAVQNASGNFSSSGVHGMSFPGQYTANIYYIQCPGSKILQDDI